MVLDNLKSHAKVKDWTYSHTKGLKTTWSVWQGMLASHEHCAGLDSLWNTSFASKLLILGF